MDLPTPPPDMKPWHRRVCREYAVGRPIRAICEDMGREPSSGYKVIGKYRAYLNGLMECLDREFIRALATMDLMTLVDDQGRGKPQRGAGIGREARRRRLADGQPPV